VSDQYGPLKQAVIDGNADLTNALVQAALAQGQAPRGILEGGLLPGMEVVGQRMKSGECFIPEVLLSARVMQGALDTLRPLLDEGPARDIPVSGSPPQRLRPGRRSDRPAGPV
jgi:5-methyltetrahydrofolate--homocysteine methyltransferase